MKTKITLLSLLTLMPLFAMAQQYCIPPSFITGPYTGITNVSLDGSPSLNNSTAYNEGYYYYNAIGSTEVEIGAQYTISVTTYDGIGYGQNTRVWIDWNSDKDFDDPGEEVAAWNEHAAGTVTQTITVPGQANLGITRMRVYTDMITSLGHISPEPCGYLNHPTHPLGQHGCIEDYDLEIRSSSGLDNENYSILIDYLIYNNSIVFYYDLMAPSNISLEVYNMIGQKAFYEPTMIKGKGSHSYTLELRAFETASGIYIVNFIIDGRRNSFKISI